MTNWYIFISLYSSLNALRCQRLACRQRALTPNNSQISLMCVMKKSSLHPGSSIARLSRRATGPLRCLSSAAPPTHLSSLSGRGEGRRETPPTIFNFHLGRCADTMATEGWRPHVSGCCRYPSMPREAMTTRSRRGGGAMETKDQSRAKYSSCGRTDESAGTRTDNWLFKCKLIENYRSHS